MAEGALENLTPPAEDRLLLQRVTLRLLSKVLVAATLCLLFAGALVTSHGAGLAVPDWPTTFGQNMFLFPLSRWEGGVFFEHTHRLIASGIGALTFVVLLFVLRVEERKIIKRLAYFAFGLVCVQGLLGGLTVLLNTPAWVSTLHALIAQTFFVTTILLAYSQSHEYNDRMRGEAQALTAAKLFPISLVAIALLFIQLLFGALMRHTESGLAVPDFPTMAGSLMPAIGSETLQRLNAARLELGLGPVDALQVSIHLLHRFGALVVVGWIGYLFITACRVARSNQFIMRTVGAIVAAVVLQFSLGALTILSVRSPILTSTHVVVGAVLLGLTTLLALRSFTFENPRDISIRNG
jgi:cytochrome c oxidase assembly protein subunit 15